MNDKSVRWKQRYQNWKKAFLQFEKNLQIISPNDAEKQGIIKSYEYTFELSWKTLKDYLESIGITALSPRDVIKQSFHMQIITDGDTWIDMLNQRNLMAHTYNEELAQKALQLIKEHYYLVIKTLMSYLEQQIINDSQ